MRSRYEFAMHTLNDPGSIDPTLALMGAQGWEIRGVTSTGARIVVALQRPLEEEMPLPDASTLAATLEEPLAAPTPAELTEPPRVPAPMTPAAGGEGRMAREE